MTKIAIQLAQILWWPMLAIVNVGWMKAFREKGLLYSKKEYSNSDMGGFYLLNFIFAPFMTFYLLCYTVIPPMVRGFKYVFLKIL